MTVIASVAKPISRVISTMFNYGIINTKNIKTLYRTLNKNLKKIFKRRGCNGIDEGEEGGAYEDVRQERE